MISVFFGCGAKKYKVDYGEDLEDFEGAKQEYRAGEKVRICFKDEAIGTDTDYSFYLDGERLDTGYQSGKGYVIEFTMPEHDVRLTVNAASSMYPDGPSDTDFSFAKTATLTFDSFDGGGPEYSISIEDPTVVSYTESHEYSKPDHEQLNGAGFKVIFTLTGIKPGSTTVAVSMEMSFKPGDAEVTYYNVTVNDALEILVTEAD